MILDVPEGIKEREKKQVKSEREKKKHAMMDNLSFI